MKLAMKQVIKRSWMIAFAFVNPHSGITMAFEYLGLVLTNNAGVRPAYTLFFSAPIFLISFLIVWILVRRWRKNQMKHY